jgi:raffinose/stachyose/melibiose transport system substrate-binding protein
MTDTPTKSGVWRWLNATTFGWAVLLAAFLASMGKIIQADRRAEPQGKIILRISHWQLETGYRDAMQWAIDEFEKRHPDVHIEQMHLSEQFYGQWLNCQLIANEAPDIAEMGSVSKFAAQDPYTLRYFMALGEVVARPNPYNAGTPLEGVPWKETFVDGMRGTYRPQLLEYFSVPTSISSTRIYVNLDLLKEATGSDAMPRTFGEYLKACDALRELGERTGRKIIPAASCYRMDDWAVLAKYRTPFTASFEPVLDSNLDGEISALETYAGLLRGQVSFQSPAVVAYYQAMEALADTLGKGFAAIDRQQAQFMFNQGQSAFLMTGSWDAAGLKQRFDKLGWRLGIMDTPLPAPDERWGQYISGRLNEAGSAGGGIYGVYKLSHNKDLAIEFLQFLTSVKINSGFNARALWVPITLGAEPADLMKPFVPNLKGFTSRIDFRAGSQVYKVLTGEELLLFNHEIDYATMSRTVDAALRNPAYGGDRAFSLEYEVQRQDARNQERVLAELNIEQLAHPDHADAAEADLDAKYRRALLQHVRKNNGEEVRWRFESLRHQPIPPAM